jgi:hypothetical protein
MSVSWNTLPLPQLFVMLMSVSWNTLPLPQLFART